MIDYLLNEHATSSYQQKQISMKQNKENTLNIINNNNIFCKGQT